MRVAALTQQGWPRLGYREVAIERDFKGPGKDRAIFEKFL
jgi:hypothetical protein